MHSIIQNHHPIWNSLDFAGSGTYFSGIHVSSLSTYQQKNTDITIMTAEGDRVTLSANSQQEASYLTYSSLVRRGSEMTQIQGKSYSMEVNQDLSITIEGDLNEEEIQDIQESIKAIDKIMQATISGNTDQALIMSQSVSYMDTISSFSANLEIETGISFVQQTAVETQSVDPEPTNSIESDLSPIPQNKGNNSRDKMMEIFQHRGFRNKKIIKPLRKYFSKLFEGIPEKYKGSEKYEKLGLADRLRSEILEHLEKEAQEKINPNPDPEPEPVIEDPTSTVKVVNTAEIDINPALTESEPVDTEVDPVDTELNEDQDPVEA